MISNGQSVLVDLGFIYVDRASEDKLRLQPVVERVDVQDRSSSADSTLQLLCSRSKLRERESESRRFNPALASVVITSLFLDVEVLYGSSTKQRHLVYLVVRKSSIVS